MRQELERTALERERLRLAAEVHDGLAQDLALAMRELALLDSGPAPEVAEASCARLRAAVASAHRTVRSRLKGMMAPRRSAVCGPRSRSCATGSRTAACRCASRATRTCRSRRRRSPPRPIRVLAEALSNCERHPAPTAPC